jgi:hypothetical protein
LASNGEAYFYESPVHDEFRFDPFLYTITDNLLEVPVSENDLG